MGLIQRLADDLVNKIAAGEVVERPASVIKELIENALDAGASRIEIAVEGGGSQRISITDNGSGMDKDDAVLAFERHATSKIKRLDDLLQVASMGFRGEALAAIAAVSKVTLLTRRASAGAQEGVKVVKESAGPAKVEPWTGPVGTTVICQDLFYNVPARAKFLKSPQVELAAIQELVQALGLCHPHIGFVLTSSPGVQGADGSKTKIQAKELLRVAPADRAADTVGFGEALLRQRTAGVLGDETTSSLLYVRRESPYGSFEALVSPPGCEKTNGKSMFLFINGRWVQDKTLRFGILRGYHSHLLRGKYPVVVVHVTMDHALVDVNVHPAKTEVRLQYGGELQGLCAIAIRETLRQGAWAAAPQTAMPMPDQTLPNAAWIPPREAQPKVRDIGQNFDLETNAPSAASRTFSSPMKFSDPSLLQVRTRVADYAVGVSTDTSSSTKFSGSEDVIPWNDLEFIGSYGRCYLMFSMADKLLVVDQHAFHERILFERLQQDRDFLRRSQPLLLPEAIILPVREVEALQARKDALALCGFKLKFLPAGDDASQGTIELFAVPALLARRNPEVVLMELAAGEGNSHDQVINAATGVAQDILATIACHSAVRAGEELPEPMVKQLVKEASSVDFYLNCPHGRRVFRWWTKDQVARWFDR